MLRDIRKNKVFNRRTFFVSGAQGALSLILVLRLAYLQIFKHKQYTIQSNSNSIKPMIKPAGRGIIIDRKGRALTQNVQNYRLYLYLEDKRDVEKLVHNLTEILNFSESDKNVLLARVKNAKRRTMISLINSLSWDDVARIELNSYRLPGTSIESEVLRRYPFPYETAHFLGYVSVPSEREVEKDEKALFAMPAFRIGKTGIEKSFDKILRGKYGVKYVEVNALERPVRTISVREQTEGPTLRLTIDLDLQKFVTKRVEGLAASVVVMDVKTGEILSYVSAPAFDANNFVEGISHEYWNELSKNWKLPLNNKPLSAIYPPGSTFKLMTALAALEKGIDPKKTFYCPGYFQLGRRRFHCWEDKGHGSLDMVGAIAHSCNVYFYNVASQIGMQPITDVAHRFGYGEKLDISLYGARTGNVPSEEWKRKVFHQPWVGGDTLNSAIGQGFVLATPLQMALITARLANGGIPIKPYLVNNQKVRKQFDELKGKSLVNKAHLDLILEGMRRVVNDPEGTSYYRRITEKGFEMAGKTGTSQVISKREDQMSRAEMLRDTNQNHAIFVGYAPVSEPKYAISVVVEHGKSGSSAAAPIGRDVLLEAQKLLQGGLMAISPSS